MTTFADIETKTFEETKFPILCTAFKTDKGKQLKKCVNQATWDLIVSCGNNHERTRKFCDKCKEIACNAEVGFWCIICYDLKTRLFVLVAIRI